MEIAELISKCRNRICPVIIYYIFRFLEEALKIEIELGMFLENLILNTLQTLTLFHLDLG